MNTIKIPYNYMAFKDSIDELSLDDLNKALTALKRLGWEIHLMELGKMEYNWIKGFTYIGKEESKDLKEEFFGIELKKDKSENKFVFHCHQLD